MSLFTKAVVGVTDTALVERLVTKTRPGKSLARRFVAGESLDVAVTVAKGLNGEGFVVSLDLLGEQVTDRESAQGAVAEYEECIERIGDEGLDANISVKLTQLGLNIDPGLAIEAIGRLAERAQAVATTVTIDMEDSRHTAATVDVYEEAQRRHGNLGLALQSYMHRSVDDLTRLMPLGGHIRICKGAYVEPREIAHQSKEAVDAAFVEMLRMIMASPDTLPAVATHDQVLIDLTKRLAQTRENPFEFQMLYGVRPTLQRELVDQGFQLRIYLPFGSQWYPYLTRRLAERPANAWFFARSVFGR